MDDVVGVAVVQRRQHLFHDVGRLLLGEVLADLELLDDLVEELSSLQVIHYDQEGFLVFEEFVDFNDCWMILVKGVKLKVKRGGGELLGF